MLLLTVIMSQATEFIASCYGFGNGLDMTVVRIKTWMKKMGNKKLNSTPELKILPPTTEVFEYHALRAHLQTSIWLSYQREPLHLNTCHFGWKYDDDEEMMIPITLPVNP